MLAGAPAGAALSGEGSPLESVREPGRPGRGGSPRRPAAAGAAQSSACRERPLGSGGADVHAGGRGQHRERPWPGSQPSSFKSLFVLGFFDIRVLFVLFTL